ncbi:MAG TPA: DUF452 family protein [Candidatus Avisuccinivibrio pullicola]|nr:DUF452 family protein [Candidatus Avisuccinivibrio pullicola]
MRIELMGDTGYCAGLPLTVLVLGFGQNGAVFRRLFAGQGDVAIIYDYTKREERSGDWEVLTRASSLRVLAWSLGVKMAPLVLGKAQAKVNYALAYNGTPWGVDQDFGLPPRGYHYLMRFLKPESAQKLFSDMVGGTMEPSFMENAPWREVEHLKEELTSLEAAPVQNAAFKWNGALVGLSDRLFPPESQVRAWEKLQVPVRVLEGSLHHYSAQVFKEVVSAYRAGREIRLV